MLGRSRFHADFLDFSIFVLSLHQILPTTAFVCCNLSANIFFENRFMQDLEALEAKSLSELKQIAKALGIDIGTR